MLFKEYRNKSYIQIIQCKNVNFEGNKYIFEKILNTFEVFEDPIVYNYKYLLLLVFQYEPQNLTSIIK